MCELLGFSSATEQDISGYLKNFSDHSKDNPHGWGLAVMQYGDISIIKEPTSADRSKLLQNLVSSEIKTSLCAAHIRLATVGDLEYKNCHPFMRSDCLKSQWTLFHNGTIFDTELTREYTSVQDGTTDSECILLYIISAINQAIARYGILTPEKRYEVLSKSIEDLSQGNKLNLMIFAYDTLFLHTNMANSLYYKQSDDSVLFATVPLDDDHWEPLPMMTLLGYKKGKLIYKGNFHSNEYIYNPDDLKGMFMTYSGL